MKSFLCLTLFCAFSLGITVQLKLNKKSSLEIRVPWPLRGYQTEVKSNFKKTENANLLFAFIFGAGHGISPYTKKIFTKNGLSFLLSPSGIHLSGVFIILGFFLKKVKRKWLRKTITISILCSVFFYPHYDAIKRLSLLRLSVFLNHLLKKPYCFEVIVLWTFSVSFALGHYFSSPLGFIFSLLYIGTFALMSDQPKRVLIAALFSNQLLIGLFLGVKVSLASVLTCLLGVALFSFLFPLLVLFFATYWIIPFNWAEPLINSYVFILKYSAKLINGTFTSSSIFMLLSLWTLLLCKKFKMKIFWAGLFLLIHTNTATAPSLFR